MSEIKVNKITPRTGTTITLGDSGDSLSIASGVALTDFTSTGIDDNATSTALTINSSGNVTIGTTNSTNLAVSAEDGIALGNSGFGVFSRASNTPLYVQRRTNDGDLITLNKDGTTVGSIASNNGSIEIDSQGSSLKFSYLGTNVAFLNNGNFSAYADNAMDLGYSGARFSDLYLGGNIYLGGTGSANALDDYEEGNWTPSLGGTTTNPTLNYNQQVGRYTKIGRTVIIDFYVALLPTGNSGGTGTLTINGFPFNVGSLNTHGKSGLSMYNGNFSTVGNGAPIGFYVNQNSTFAYFRSPASSYPSSSVHTSTQASDVGNNLIVAGTLTYQIT